MTKEEHLLTILVEECVETAQRVTKAIRFGLTEIQPGQELTNAQRIIYEFNDIVAMIYLIQDEGVINDSCFDMEAMKLKKEKVKKYMDYSTKLGTIKN